jgi:sec-independent protein translocase protein TatA
MMDLSNYKPMLHDAIDGQLRTHQARSFAHQPCMHSSLVTHYIVASSLCTTHLASSAREHSFVIMKVSAFHVFLILAALMASEIAAFVPSPSTRTSLLSGPFQSKTPSILTQKNVPAALLRQRRSVTSVQTMGLFGLGLPEIALILVVAVFLLGPQKIGELVKDSGKAAGELADELKNVPDEFKKGLEEGETEARSRKAKTIKPVSKEEDDE